MKKSNNKKHTIISSKVTLEEPVRSRQQQNSQQYFVEAGRDRSVLSEIVNFNLANKQREPQAV